jgi:hypothetical protein
MATGWLTVVSIAFQMTNYCLLDLFVQNFAGFDRNEIYPDVTDSVHIIS